MANLNQMLEHCEQCGDELEVGQIGLCDYCQDIKKCSEESSEDGDTE